MSTKAIREALKYYEMHVSAGSYGEAIVGAAREEVEAIEKAAKSLDDNLAAQVFASNPQDVEAALDVMESIAKDAK